MIWTDINYFSPPSNIWIYVQYNDGKFYAHLFTPEEVPNLLSLSKINIKIQLIKEDNNLDEEEKEEQIQELKMETYIIGWSFIPMIPPGKINPILDELTQKVYELENRIEKLKKELNSINNMDCIMNIINNLQMQISSLNPDEYHKWKVNRLRTNI